MRTITVRAISVLVLCQNNILKYRDSLVVAMIAVICLTFHDPACAGTIPTEGQGAAVTSIDRFTTFDDLDYAHNGTPLSNFLSGGLYIRTNGNSYYGDNSQGNVPNGGPYFNPFHLTSASPPNYSYAGVGGGFYFPYDGDFGNTDWLTIETQDAVKIYAVEFLYGNGWSTGDIYGTQTGYPWGNSGAHLDWKTLVGGSVVSSGTTTYLSVGTVIGFYDPNGFDQLMVRSSHPNSSDPNLQELAIDNLNVQVTIPEPATLSLLGLGLAGLLVRPKRK
jgi:hypothetical protein